MFNLDDTQPAIYLPPNEELKNRALVLIKEIMEPDSKEKKLETYLELEGKRKLTKNPHYADFLLEIMDFLWYGLSPEQRNWLNTLN